jgi:hypothetical protein
MESMLLLLKKLGEEHYSRLLLKIIRFEYCAFLGQFVAVIGAAYPDSDQPCLT